MHHCPQCTKTFELKRYLTKHIQRLHYKNKSTEVNQPLVCSMCEKAFPRLSHLQRHQMTHLNVRNWACEFCEEKFVQKCHLTRHLMRKHVEEKKEEEGKASTSSNRKSLFACPKCGCLFKTSYELTAHRENVHRPGRCDNCRKIVFGVDDLRKHKMKCRNESRLCTMCGATFKREADLRSHQNSCLKRASFQCIPCDELFKQRVQLDRHINKFHFQEEACEKCGIILDSPIIKKRHFLICLQKEVCGYCGIEQPEKEHISEKHWQRFKKPVNLMNKHKPKSLIEKKEVKEIEKEEEEVDKNKQTNEEENEEEEKVQRPSISFDALFGSSHEEKEIDDDSHSPTTDFKLDSPSMLFDNSFQDGLFFSDENEDEIDDEKEDFLTFEISPDEKALSYQFKGRLPDELIKLFPVLEETTIVLLDAAKFNKKMIVQVPVVVKKGAETWLGKTISL